MFPHLSQTRGCWTWRCPGGMLQPWSWLWRERPAGVLAGWATQEAFLEFCLSPALGVLLRKSKTAGRNLATSPAFRPLIQRGKMSSVCCSWMLWFVSGSCREQIRARAECLESWCLEKGGVQCERWESRGVFLTFVSFHVSVINRGSWDSIKSALSLLFPLEGQKENVWYSMACFPLAWLEAWVVQHRDASKTSVVGEVDWVNGVDEAELKVFEKQLNLPLAI